MATMNQHRRPSSFNRWCATICHKVFFFRGSLVSEQGRTRSTTVIPRTINTTSQAGGYLQDMLISSPIMWQSSRSLDTVEQDIRIRTAAEKVLLMVYLSGSAFRFILASNNHLTQ